MTKEFPFPFPERYRSLSEHNPALPRLFFPWRNLARCVAVTPKTGRHYASAFRCTDVLACILPIHVFGHFSQYRRRVDNRGWGSFEWRRDRLLEKGGEARSKSSKKRKEERERKKQKTRCWSVWVKKAKLALLCFHLPVWFRRCSTKIHPLATILVQTQNCREKPSSLFAATVIVKKKQKREMVRFPADRRGLDGTQPWSVQDNKTAQRCIEGREKESNNLLLLDFTSSTRLLSRGKKMGIKFVPTCDHFPS